MHKSQQYKTAVQEMSQDHVCNCVLRGEVSADFGRKGIPRGGVTLGWKDNCGLVGTQTGDEQAVWTLADEFRADLCGLEQGFSEVIRLVLDLEGWVEFE